MSNRQKKIAAILGEIRPDSARVPVRVMDSAKREREQLLRVLRHYVALKNLGQVLYGTCPVGGSRLALWPDRALSCGCCEAEHWRARTFIQAVEGVNAKQAAAILGRRKWTPLAPIYEIGASEATPRKKPMRRPRLKQICGARNRRGEPCACKQLFRSGRCRYHGGLSTGPKTPEGKARVKLNLPHFRRKQCAPQQAVGALAKMEAA